MKTVTNLKRTSPFQGFNGSVFYGLSCFCTSLCVLSFLPPSNLVVYLMLSVLFGVFYGVQSVYQCILPVEIFGKENLTVVLGWNFFCGGIGALFGAPIAGD